jgi:hypothetical protein
MDSHDLISQLRSPDSTIMLKAMLSLSSPSRRETPLTAEIVARLSEITRYQLDANVDEEQKTDNEMMRYEAISLLGIYYRVYSAFGILAGILSDRRDTDFILTTAISGIFSIGSQHKDTRVKAEQILVSVALDEKFSAPVREAANLRILRMKGKISERDYGAALAGKISPTLDMPWLQSLKSNPNS